MICRDTPTHGWVCGWMGGSVGQWVGLGQSTNWPNWDNSILFEDLLFVETPPPTGGCVGVWVGQWVNGWVRSTN